MIWFYIFYFRFHISFFLWELWRWLGIWKLIFRSWDFAKRKTWIAEFVLKNLSDFQMFAVIDCSQSFFFFFFFNFFKMTNRPKLIYKDVWVFYLIKYEGTLHFLFSNNNHIKFWSLTHLVNHNEMKWALALYKKK